MATEPTFFPEVNRPLSGDNEHKLLAKIAGSVYNMTGGGTAVPVSGTVESYVSTFAKGSTSAGYPTSTGAGVDRQPLDTILRDSTGAELLGSKAIASSIPVALGNDLTITGQAAMTTGNNAIATDGATATSATGFHSGSVQVVGSAGIASGAVTFEQSNDGTNYSVMPVIEQSLTGQSIVTAATTIAASTARVFIFAVTCSFIRLRISTTISGGTIRAYTNLSQLPFANPALTVTQGTAANLNATVSATNLSSNMAQFGGQTVVTAGVNGTQAVGGNVAHSAAATTNPAQTGGRVITTLDTSLTNNDTCYNMYTSAGQHIIKQYGSAENDWQYAAAASGIVNTTTAVTIKAAAAASIRNYLTSFELEWETLGSATEFVVRDGAAGTVIYRTKLGTAAGRKMINFPVPIRGTAATLLEIATLTASVTGAVYFNASGYTSF